MKTKQQLIDAIVQRRVHELQDEILYYENLIRENPADEFNAGLNMRRRHNIQSLREEIEILSQEKAVAA